MAGYSITFQAVEAFIEPESAGAAFGALFDERDTTDLHADIGEHLVNATGERFEAERAPDGAPWAPLSPATLISGYQKRAKANRAFKLTGRGARSGRGNIEMTAGFARYVANKKILQEQGRRGGLLDGIVYQPGDGFVRIGTNKVYGRIHQLGGEAGRGRSIRIPARPYVGVSDDDELVIGGIIRRWIEEQVGG